MDKKNYLKHQLTADYGALPSETPANFGKMNVHQMIEHMTYAFQQASGKIPLKPVGDDETTAKMYRFMMSDKPFRDNTPNPYLPDEPATPVTTDTKEALSQLQNAINDFFETFKDQADLRISNPFFGNLNFEEWVHLLFKHSQHHLRQFSS